MGGGTPAALAADWSTSAIDQIAFNWVSSPFAMRIEQVALAWLQELFGLPAAWSGVFTSGATIRELHGPRGRAPLVGAAARRRRRGGGPRGPAAGAVLASGYVHASALEGARDAGDRPAQVRTFPADESGRLDPDALAAALRELGGAPAIWPRPPAT